MMSYTDITDLLQRAASLQAAEALLPTSALPPPNGRPRRFRTIWISDTHLGTRGCQADYLLDFLRSTESEYLYLVGDIVDGWSLKRSWYWDDTHTAVIQTILGKAADGTRVIYVPGNHDEFAREYVDSEFGGIQIRRDTVHETADGRRLLILHGDEFDGVVAGAKWLAMVGDVAYQATLVGNRWFNYARRKLGYPYWSLSAFLKHQVKNAVAYVGDFEAAVARAARERDADGVVCGHIHCPQQREIDGIEYCNDGDWVESCTALVEDERGRLSILRWTEEVAGRTQPTAANSDVAEAA